MAVLVARNNLATARKLYGGRQITIWPDAGRHYGINFVAATVWLSDSGHIQCKIFFLPGTYGLPFLCILKTNKTRCFVDIFKGKFQLGIMGILDRWIFYSMFKHEINLKFWKIILIFYGFFFIKSLKLINLYEHLSNV